MAEKKIAINSFSGGQNTVTAREFLASDTVEYMLNCNVLSTGVGNTGIITNPLGNTIIPTSLPNGENYRIGYASDEETNNFYTFMWNSLGYHTIYRYNSLERKETVVLMNLIDTNNIDILRFDRNFLILHADVVENNLLYWVDGINPARKINIDKCLDKSTAGYGTIIREEFINAYKRTSAFAPTAVYFSDTTKQFNRFYGRLTRYIQRYIYDDNEKSNWSEYSNVPLPSDEPITGISAIPSNNNGIKISVETGAPNVKHIEIAMQTTDASSSSSLGVLDFVLIASLDKDVLGIDSDSTYTYDFYNDGRYAVTDIEKVIRPYSFMFKRPLCQNIVKNALIYWNGYEGFDNVALNTTVSVAYQDLFIESGVENEFNDPLFERTAHSIAYVNGPGGDRETYETLVVGPDVKKGNIFKLWLNTTASSGLSSSWTYTATAFDTASTVANYFRTKINEWHIGKAYLDPISVDLDGNASFNYGLRSTEYFEGYTDVTPIQFNSLKDTGESINNIKLGSAVKLGITYEDEDGRKSLAYTVDGLIINISTINELGGFKKPVITLQIKHRPPIWAKYYQIVRSDDLVYDNYIQLLIQRAIEVQGTTDTEYLDLVVGGLFTYQKLHENTVLKYTFTKGDRLRLINWVDTNLPVDDPSYRTYYDFYETEILSYKDEVIEDKNEIISTTVDSPTVTIGGSTNTDNIGRILLIDGAERTITGVPSGNTYTLDQNMTETTKFLSYKLIDRRGTLRIRKPSTSVIASVNDLSLVEIYTPAAASSSADIKDFNEFGVKFPIINWGTDTRAHAGISQNQDGTNSASLITTPAIIEIDNGTAYVRNRELPITNNVPGAQVLVDSIEDPGYSDYYNSTFNDNGRPTVKDTGDGEVHFEDRARFSNNRIEDTRINGLNDFDNLDRVDYNDAYGAIKRVIFKENRCYVFKALRDTWVPVRQSILSQADGTEVVGLSSKLLNDMQYFSYEGGIGDNPESLSVNATWIYHVMPSAGVLVRIGGSGVVPISEIYQLDNTVQDYLKEAKKYSAKIFSGFNRKLGNLFVTISNYIKSMFRGGFNAAQWTSMDELITATYEVVTPPTHGAVTLTSATQWTYTPTADYTGPDSFSYRAFINGAWSDPKNICLTVNPSTLTATGWRQKASTVYCVTDGSRQTGYKGWTTLEQYILGLGALTGVEKPNVSTDANYIAPIYDTTTCIPDPEQFTFTDLTNQTLSTLVVSNSITVTGIGVAVPISITGGEYRITRNGVVGSWTSASGSVELNDIVEVRQTTSADDLTPTNAVLTIASVSDTFTATTGDTTPDSYSFTDVTDATTSTLYESNTITITGITLTVPVTITGGEYSKNGGAYTSVAGTAVATDTFKVRQTSSASGTTSTNTVLTVGKTSDTYTVTTAVAPEQFIFIDQTGAQLNTVTESNAITVTNFPPSSAISITTPGEYQVNGGTWVTTAGTVSDGDIVKVRVTSSNTNDNNVSTTLTIGSLSDTFTVTTGYAFNVESYGGENSVVQLLNSADSGVIDSETIIVDGSWINLYSNAGDVLVRVTNNRGFGISLEYSIREGIDNTGTVLYSGIITNSGSDGETFTTPALTVRNLYVRVFTA